MGELSEIMAGLKMRGGEKNVKEKNDIKIFHFQTFFKYSASGASM